MAEDSQCRFSFIKRVPTHQARRHFLGELRSARAQAQKNAEDFSDLLFAIERLGAFVSVDSGGDAARGLKGLGDYELALGELAQFSSLGGHPLEERSRRWHSTFDTLFNIVREARNSALHEGAKARHLAEHAIELTLILEEALRRMPEELRTVGDLMVRSPVVAEEWQPVSFVRQAMLTNSFSFLPIFLDGTWKLLSDHFVAYYLNKAPSNNQRRISMPKGVGVAISETSEMPLPSALMIIDTASIGELLRLKPPGETGTARGGGLSAPVLVLDSGRMSGDLAA